MRLNNALFSTLLLLFVGLAIPPLHATVSGPLDSLTLTAEKPLTPISERRTFAFAPLEEADQALPPDDDDLAPGLVEVEEAAANAANVVVAREKVRDALAAGRFIQRLDELSWQEFPVILTDTISNVPIVIVFDRLLLYPEYAELEVTVEIELPQKTVSEMTGQNGSTGSENGPTRYVKLYFGAPSVRFSHDGGLIDATSIGLLADTPVGMSNPNKFGFILKRMPSSGLAAGTGASGTYVTIDCDGFVEMGIDAEVFFSRDWIVPVDDNDLPESGRVEGRIATVVNDWQNILVEMSLPNFAPASYTDVAFHLSRAIFDFSDFRNGNGMTFPTGYAEQGLVPPSPSLWRGVYIEELQLALPRQIKDRDCQVSAPAPGPAGGTGMLLLDAEGDYAYGTADTLQLPDNPTTNFELKLPEYLPPLAGDSGPLEMPLVEATTQNCRIEVGVNNLLIDGQGVSGYFYAENVLPLEMGRMDKWRFSISDLVFELMANEVVGFGFGGELGLPISKREQAFEYDAFYNIPDRSINVLLATMQSYNFPIFKMADVHIAAGSYLDVTVTPDRFEPAAVLHGYAAIRGKLLSRAPDGDDSQDEEASWTISAPRIDFTGLRLATRGTLIGLEEDGGSITVSVGLKVAGYEVPIPEPTLTLFPDGRTRLRFNIRINLMNQADNGFAAEADTDIKGELREENREQYWVSAGMSVSRLEVDIRLEGLEIQGFVHLFEDDPVFGKGFQGGLIVKVGKYEPPGDPLVQIELNAMFGKNEFRYWYVDGFLELDRMGILLPPTPLEINGFGGGAYYHMRMSGADLDGGGDGSLGTMTSGVSYVPDEDTVLGLKASIALRTTGTDNFDGLVTLELRFVQTGLQEIAFYGKGEIIPPNGIPGTEVVKFSDKLRERLTDLPLERSEAQDKDKEEVEAPYDRILATVFLRMNFELGFEFQGTARAYISAGQGAIVGQGGLDILISGPQNRWHYYIGGYTDNSIIAGDGDVLPPVGVYLDMGAGIEAGAEAYFLVGNDIPGPPPLDPLVAAAFNLTEVPGTNREELGDRAALGTGFAFGGSVYATIDKSIGSSGKTRLIARVGAGCDVSLLKYQTDTYCSVSGDSPHGHKGWRATGRIWAFLEGRAERGWFEVGLAIGVLIDADLPKPTYLLLAGMFEIGPFNVNFEKPLGDQCGIPLVGSN